MGCIEASRRESNQNVRKLLDYHCGNNNRASIIGSQIVILVRNDVSGRASRYLI